MTRDKGLLVSSYVSIERSLNLENSHQLGLGVVYRRFEPMASHHYFAMSSTCSP